MFQNIERIQIIHAQVTRENKKQLPQETYVQAFGAEHLARLGALHYHNLHG